MKHCLRDIHINHQLIEALHPYSRNPRTHSKKQIQKLVDSIRTFGFTNPILIDATKRVIAGHGRLAAAKLLGLETVPTICLEYLTEEQVRAYVIADNRLAELAGWDRELLALELQYLDELEIDFDLTITGFDTSEIDVMIEGLDPVGNDDEANEIPAMDTALPPVSREGDLFLLGPHRLLCGDARHKESYQQLMGSHPAHMVFVDPPYNVPMAGHAVGLGSIQHHDFAMAAGEMSEGEFTAFLQALFSHLTAFSQDGAIHFICMDWRHLYELLTAARSAYHEIKNLVVWNKSNGGMGSFYRSKHELILVAKNGPQPHINNFELGQQGRYRTNVWDYAGVNAFREGRLEELSMHPTVKPVALVADAIKDCSHRNGIILDCCAGSGTTLMAAEQTGRKAYVMELDPRYVDTAILRWQSYTGYEAFHAKTGQTFEERRKEVGHE
ncbi:DNA methyltransferase [Candidatus Nitronereus thalassa]|uniref:Methyltransferase n=1 Tax=Candidatus Nitronereus thalassa TaxID=3020898 RepID=A0ABU3K331_9BACT|nr:DNA methyltransferase [Candidatus Nitronereus thalassa]MDT7040790.1 site-specific DNA-methyltransferase [Candidatus Nitronereus thalassa]